jgi:hypothetical protein
VIHARKVFAAVVMFVVIHSAHAEMYDVVNIGPNGRSYINVSTGYSRYNVDLTLPNNGKTLGFGEGSSNFVGTYGIYSINQRLSLTASLTNSFAINSSEQWLSTVRTTEGARSSGYSVGIMATLLRREQRDGFRLDGSFSTSNSIPSGTQSYRVGLQPQYWFESGYLLAADVGATRSEGGNTSPYTEVLIYRRVTENITLNSRLKATFVPESSAYSSYRIYSLDLGGSYEIDRKWLLFGSLGVSRRTTESSDVYIENYANHRSSRISVGIRYGF